MAVPRVFVSSTCYDLKEVRDNLYEFISSLGYIPVFSDKNDVFYHPDLHTHEACIKEIENCQLFILIIGGRFGGTYKYDKAKSIVNAEYDAAKALELPIFTFVQKNVYSDQFTYSKNIKNELAEKINYPSITNQEYAKNIFEFIISIRQTNFNNGLFEFEFTRDIKNIMKIQFAGLFYDFLWNRKKIKESNKTKSLLYNLTSLSKKTEELIENIYRKVEKNNPNVLISKLDLEEKARNFWHLIAQIFNIQLNHMGPNTKKKFSEVKDEYDWVKFLSHESLNFRVIEITDKNMKKTKALYNGSSNIKFNLELIESKEVYPENKATISILEENFDAYKKLTVDKKLEMLNSFEI